jgi:hypothetical protein
MKGKLTGPEENERTDTAALLDSRWELIIAGGESVQDGFRDDIENLSEGDPFRGSPFQVRRPHPTLDGETKCSSILGTDLTPRLLCPHNVGQSYNGFVRESWRRTPRPTWSRWVDRSLGCPAKVFSPQWEEGETAMGRRLEGSSHGPMPTPPRAGSPLRSDHDSELPQRLTVDDRMWPNQSRAGGARSLSDSSPIFILCSARSGSTLLRVLLDGHPDIAVPPETNISVVFHSIMHSVASVATGEEASRLMRECCRSVAAMTLGEYACSRGKQRWADKSLTSVDQSETLIEIYPDARFICLHRHGLDTVRSAMEASPWGFGGYGLTPYVASTPGNFLIGLFEYWVDKASRLLNFQVAHPQQCYRLRYEDLVRGPVATIEAVCDFLGAPWAPDRAELDMAVSEAHSEGPGDYKLPFTSAVLATSVGRGSHLPISTLPPSLLERVNKVLLTLEYAPLSSPDLPDSSPSSAVEHEPRENTRPITSIEQLFSQRVSTRLASLASSSGIGARFVTVVLTDTTSSWTLDLTTGAMQTEGQATVPSRVDFGCLLETDSEVLLGVANGTTNPGVALRQGRVRIAVPDERGSLSASEARVSLRQLMKLFI